MEVLRPGEVQQNKSAPMDQLFNNDIELIEPEHRYALKSNPEIEFTSVTSLTSKYFEPFNKFEVAKRLVETNVKYFGMTVDQLIASGTSPEILVLLFTIT